MDTRQIQAALSRLGYDPGPVDGLPGRRTTAAIKAFQTARKIPADGIVGPNTLRLLFGAATNGTLGSTAVAPPTLPVPVPPWMEIARQKKGLNEVKDRNILMRFLKSDGKTLGDPAVLPWCFRGDVEILTEDGWQRFDNLTAARVYQVDESGATSLSTFHRVTKKYDGPAYNVGGSLGLICDAGHRWFGSWRRGARPTFGTLGEVTSEGLSIPAFRSSSNGIELSDAELCLIAAFMSDGSMHRGKVAVQVSRTRKIIALQNLTPQHVYTAPRAYGPLSRVPLTTFTFDIPTCFDFAFSAYKTLSRAFVNGLSQDQAQRFLAHYATFDGSTRPKDGRVTLYTSDVVTRDDLITLVSLAGYRPNLETGGASNLTKKPSFRIGFMPKATSRRIRKADVREARFTGTMHCVTVPEGRIIVRGTELQPTVTGNCGDFVETCIALALPAEPMVANPYYAQNWRKFGDPAPQAGIGCILVFVRPGGGHVGFYEGEDDDHFSVLGGNQSNAITIARVAKARCVAIRWPQTYTFKPAGAVRGAGGAISTNEA